MMKLKYVNRIISLIVSFAVLVTTLCVAVTANSSGTIDSSIFTAYYTASVSGAANGTSAFKEIDVGESWSLSEDGTMLSRKFEDSVWGEDVDKNMSVLYYNAKEYRNFDMTVQYKTAANYGDWVTFFGFGGEMGKSWTANAGDTAFILHAGGLLLNAKNKNWYSGSAVSDQTNNAGGSWNASGVHTLRLKVFEGGFTVWIDGYKLSSGSNAKYDGGYIWFAANGGGVSFGTPEVTELVDTSAYTAYYSSDLSDSETVTETSLGLQWSLSSDNTRLTRNLDFNGDYSYNDWGTGTNKHMSILYYNSKSYKYFDMTVDYKTHNDTSNYVAFAGFGSKIGKSWNSNNGDYPLVLRADGAIADVKKKTVITQSGNSAAEQTAASGEAWDSSGLHKLRILVNENKYTVWIDGYEVASGELNDYEGGYIYVAANAGTVEFGVPTVTEFIDESAFASYYSSDILNSDITASDLNTHWTKTDDKTMIERNETDTDNSGGFEKKTAILYLQENEYNNFKMDVYYCLTDSGQQLIFGFGAQMGKSWKINDSDNSFVLSQNGGLIDAKTSTSLTGDNSASALAATKGNDWNDSGVHTLSVTADNCKFTVSVDGYTLAEISNEDYAGGYIYFAANTKGVKLGMPNVVSTDEKVEPLDTSIYTPYFTESMKNGTLRKIEFSDYWGISKNKAMAVRKDINNTLGEDVDSNMAILYLNTKSYKNFNMTVNFSTLANYGDWVAFFGFGAEMGKSWTENAGDTAFIYHPGGLVLNAKNKNWYSGTAVSNQVASAGGKWVADGVHTLRIMVYEGSFTVWIDGYKLTTGKNSSYKGGYIYFAANAGNVQFGTPTVTEIMDNSVFDAYYCADLKTNETMETAVIENQWNISDDGMRLTRKFDPNSNGDLNDWGGRNKYMSVLYYNASQYTDFIMTVDYKMAATNCLHAFVGFGGELGKSWKHSDSDITLAISADGSLADAESGSDWLASGSDTAAAKAVAAGATWNSTGIHTLKIRMSNGTYTVWIDGYRIGERTVTNYQGGYIYFAASAGGVQFGTPTVTIPADTSVFSAYYSTDVSTDALEAENFSEHWELSDDGFMARRKSGDDVLGEDVKSNMGILYYNPKKYLNFDMTVEFTTLAGYEDWVTFFGFGAKEMGTSWSNDALQTSFIIHAGGLILNAKNKAWYDATAASDATIRDGLKWKADSNHILRLKVEDCYYEVWIDGYLVAEGGNWDYEGGYIYFAANAGGVRFGVPQVTSLDAEQEWIDPDYVDLGWQPDDEDSEFDFSVKRGKKASIHKYIPVNAEKK